MPKDIKTPGVYIEEVNAFGNAVIPVPTAVPAFIGFTQETSFDGGSLLNKAVKINSLAEFLTIFGSDAPKVQHSVKSTPLPERLANLEAEVVRTQAILDKANMMVKKVGNDATDGMIKAQTNAKTSSDAANEALSTVKADKTIKALLDAKDKLPKDETKPTKIQLAAVFEAQKTYDEAIVTADFAVDGYAYSVKAKTINYRLYSALKFFYLNGGSQCYIMSIGGYNYTKGTITDTKPFTDAITLLEKEKEPTILVIPDVVEIADPTVTDPNEADYLKNKFANAYSLQSAMINHCGKMQNRFAILDVPRGFTEPMTGTTSVEQFRDSVEPQDPRFNSYAAVYYPWLHTTVYQTSEIGYENLDPASYLQVVQLLTYEFTDLKTGALNENIAPVIQTFSSPANATKAGFGKGDSMLQNLSNSYQLLMKTILVNMNLIAPSAGMAGIYTYIDNNDGVWNAPANVGIQSTIMPSIKIDNKAQQYLNVPISGKSVCAIRAFTGRGNLVWGARTLDGNSNDWRYINVRRTLMFIEQSVKEATKAYEFEANDATTWVNIKNMIDSFLTGLWKQGALVGAKPADAFSVKVGLGSTMSSDDIQQGIMRISVMVAVMHPAEFMVITFQQNMQKA
ncbi:phage tail sheath protein FI [Aequorivita sublithincola DSM 14238]|uniref:Phage tail sheath protein FI n=1 Tax=Aequorivita sublithincola (strain DSM 14238 / LMG 21431 / ACAM 643 / 9-3) TaxID=746697 RepID=I3YW26_AEQSU|nr:phage tail sheath C-terminal domain-containing protein [Aequorivita sublithincola]AFL81194.1 phage tail sheath protein FI [Aequorivita sublithincola DSM 14238]